MRHGLSNHPYFEKRDIQSMIFLYSGRAQKSRMSVYLWRFMLYAHLPVIAILQACEYLATLKSSEKDTLILQ